MNENDSPQNLDIFKHYPEEHISYALKTRLVRLTRQNPGPVGATTLIVVVVWNDRLFFGSIGDSVLYYVDQGSYGIINPNDFHFLNEPELDPGILNIGSGDIKPGAAIVLATDGLPECIYGEDTLTPKDIAGSPDTSPTLSAINLVELAFSKGGEDNLGLVVYHHRE